MVSLLLTAVYQADISHLLKPLTVLWASSVRLSSFIEICCPVFRSIVPAEVLFSTVAPIGSESDDNDQERLLIVEKSSYPTEFILSFTK
jgi:hypothetical protein